MVLHNPNNWHWVNKDVSAWAKDYLADKLTAISAEEDGVTAKISKLVSMDGDVDVSQRKGKVITLFDVQVQLEYEGKPPNENQYELFLSSIAYVQYGLLAFLIGTTAEGESVNGAIKIPEVAHDTEEDEYAVRPFESPVFVLIFFSFGETVLTATYNSLMSAFTLNRRQSKP